MESQAVLLNITGIEPNRAGLCLLSPAYCGLRGVDGQNLRFTLELLLALRASVHGLSQERPKVVDAEVDMDWRPMSLIAANVVGALGRPASRRRNISFSTG